MKWLSAVILLCGVAIVLGIIFISPTENIRLEAFCQTHGYGWRGTPRDGIFCVDERGRLIPPRRPGGKSAPSSSTSDLRKRRPMRERIARSRPPL